MNRQGLKREAKLTLKQDNGYFYKLFLPYTLLMVITDLFSVFTYSNSNITESLPFVIITQFLLFGVIYAILPYLRKDIVITDNSKLSTGNVITSTYSKLTLTNMLHVICIQLISGIFIILGFICFIVPGVILALGYSQVMYILVDKIQTGKPINYLDILKESRMLMDGFKLDYFILGLSFIGWFILSAFTLGLLGFYIYPYLQTVNAIYYRELVDMKLGKPFEYEEGTNIKTI